MNEKLFLNYESDSKDKVLEYFNILNDKISMLTDNEFPQIGGKFEKKVYDFLADKELKYEEQDIGEVLNEMALYFRGTSRWHHPYVMNNIKTPVNLPAAVTAFHAMLLDPNLAGDTNCGQMAFAELEVCKYISQLLGWNWKTSGGYFTFGGTSTIMNGVKVGINKAQQGASTEGVNENLFIVSSQQGHSAHADVSNWLGIGSGNCYRIPVDNNYQMDIGEAEKLISEKIEKGGRLAAIITCGGTTIQALVDPIKEVFDMRERIVEKYNLDYRPHIHADSVVGWVWLFYKGYDYKHNPLEIPLHALKKIERMEHLVTKSYYADSFGVDFHKTGFCPYASSLFIAKDGNVIQDLNNKSRQDIESLEYGQYSPSSYTLELSRSSQGPITALTSLKLLGIQGYRRLLGEIVNGSSKLALALDNHNEVEVTNLDTNGTCILFILKPPHSTINYEELPETDTHTVIEIAKYNYDFYLFVLNMINKREINFFIDYSSGYEKIKRGFHMGVLKMQTFNPMLTEELVDELYNMIINLKKAFDCRDQNYIYSPIYTPKPMKLTHNNKKY